MADNLLIDPTGLGSLGLLNGQFDPEQFQQQQQNAGLLGFSQGLLSASGASRLPVTLGAALGAGMQGMQQARGDYLKQQLTGAQIPLVQANVAKVGLEAQALKQQLANAQGFNTTLIPILNRLAAAQAPAAPAPGGGIAAPAADDGTAQAPSAPTVSSYTADATLPREARALLDSIAGPESSGAYDVRYTPKGGATFQGFDAHPNIPEPGPQGPSTAAGRYQMVHSTYQPIAEKLGLSDFSPVSQDQGAWHLAQETYQGRTGRDLLGDLQSGRTQDVVGALRDQWPTIGKAIGSYANNLQKYTAGGAAVGQAQQPNDLPGVPDFAGMMTGNQGSSYVPQGNLTIADGDNGKPFVPTSGRAQGNLDPRFVNPDTGRPSIPPNIPVNSQGMPYSPTLAGGGGNIDPAVVKGFAQANGNPSDAAYQRYAQGGGTDSQDVWSARNAPMYRQTPAGAGGQPSPQGAPAASAMTPATSAYAQYAQNGGKDSPQVWAQRNAPMYAQQPKAGNAVPPIVSPLDLVVLEAQSALAGPAYAGQAKAIRDLAYPEAGFYRGVDGKNYPVQGTSKDPAYISSAETAKATADARAKFPLTFARPHGALPEVDANGNPTGRFTTAPALGERVNPDGSQSPVFTQLTPQGPVTTAVPGITKLGPGQTKTLENSAAVQPLTLQSPITQSGPGYTEPLKSEAGTTIPPATAATPIQGPKEYLDERAKEYSKVESAWGDSVQSSAEAQQRMTAIMDALKQYQSGAFASHLSDINASLKAAHLPTLPDSIAGDPAQAQIILKNNFAAAIQTMKATGLSRWTQAELFSSQKNLANPDLQPGANLAIGAQTIGTLQWEQQMLRDFEQSKKYGGFLDPQDFQRQWVQANPIQPFIDKAEQKIGPLKGMPGAADVAAPKMSDFNGKPHIKVGDTWYTVK